MYGKWYIMRAWREDERWKSIGNKYAESGTRKHNIRNRQSVQEKDKPPCNLWSKKDGQKAGLNNQQV